MTSDFDLDTHFTTMKKLNALPIEAQWEETVKQHLRTAYAMAKICDSADLPKNSIDLANIFQQRVVD